MKQPIERKLDGIPIRILNVDTGIYETRILTDCTKEQRLEWFTQLDVVALSSVAEHLSQCLRLIGDHYELNTTDALPKPAGEIEVVINNCYGGFGLSDEACEALIAKGWPVFDDNTGTHEDIPYYIIRWCPGSAMPMKFTPQYTNENEFRSHPDLVTVIKALGDKANSTYSELKVIKIPGNVEWTITEYDGIEQVEEVHQSWG
jgi:hypothetical protein